MLLNSFKKILPKWRRAKAKLNFDAAGNGKRLRNWQGASGSINQLLDQNLDTLRSRSRHIVLNNPVAKNAVDTIVANCVGTGIKPQSKAKDEKFRQELHELWSIWKDEADISGVNDFYGLQALICQSMIEGGSCFVRFKIGNEDLSVPLQLQAIEAEHLDRSQNSNLENGNIIKNGIEFNKSGKRIAYYLFANHPGDNFVNSDISPIRVPASEILHIFKPIRLGQIDGVPWLNSVLLKIHELDKYDDAEILRKQTAAMFAGFITRLDPEDNVLAKSDEYEDEEPIGLIPGTMQLLEPGEDIKFSDPADVGSNYEGFMRQQLRSIAIGMGITYEQLSGDLTGVNYSSIRAGLLEARRKCEMLQRHILVHQLCRPVWQKWYQLAILSGAIAEPKDKRKAKIARWIPQGWDWVDPLKDQKAQQMAVRNGFKSRSQVVSEMGNDAEEIDKEIEADNKRADDCGVRYDSDCRRR